jgi:hypothetical protein
VHPVRDVVERVPIRNVVHEYYGLCAAEIRGGDVSKSFLSRGIPNLQFHNPFRNSDVLDFKVNSDGGDEAGGKPVVDKAQQQTRLPNTCFNQVQGVRCGSIPSRFHFKAVDSRTAVADNQHFDLRVK